MYIQQVQLKDSCANKNKVEVWRPSDAPYTTCVWSFTMYMGMKDQVQNEMTQQDIKNVDL